MATDKELELAIMTALERGWTLEAVKAKADECARIIREEMPWIAIATPI